MIIHSHPHPAQKSPLSDSFFSIKPSALLWKSSASIACTLAHYSRSATNAVNLFSILAHLIFKHFNEEWCTFIKWSNYHRNGYNCCQLNMTVVICFDCWIFVWQNQFLWVQMLVARTSHKQFKTVWSSWKIFVNLSNVENKSSV